MDGGKRLHRAKQLLKVLWQNRREIPLAWKILTQGICDGCSVGAYGLRDDVLRGFHVCMTRLERLRFHTMGALGVSRLTDVSRLKDLRPDRLRALGRLPYPMLRNNGARGFVRVGWDEAFQLACDSIRNTAPHEMGFLAAGSGLSNEAYYVFQKLARVLGTNNLALGSSGTDAVSGTALHATLGVGAASCSLADVIDTDLLVIFASDLAAVEPQILKYLRAAKKRGTRIIAVHRSGELATFHTKLMDDSFPARIGGETAFMDGVLKALIAWDKIDHEFIARHTDGFDRLAAALAAQPWEALEQRSGLFRSDMQRFAARYRAVSSAVFVYCSQPAQHERSTAIVKALVNLALARGMLGREKCGILPILSESGVQGGGDCGVQPDKFSGGVPIDDESARRFSNLWYHPVPSNPGLNRRQLIEAAHRRKIKFLYSIGGDLPAAPPDARFVAEALARIPMRIHQDIALTKSHLVHAGETVLILPAQTPYEQRGGGTTTSTDRRIVFSAEIPRRVIGESLPDWAILAAIGRRSMPNGDFLFPFSEARTIRAEMARVMPIYAGIEKLNRPGDHLQWGGPHLFKGGKFRGMPGERALFSVLEPHHSGIPRPR
jgi:molybdopterin-dependent oxidoreductase alpha subunit